jgi:hypothetical protein
MILKMMDCFFGRAAPEEKGKSGCRVLSGKRRIGGHMTWLAGQKLPPRPQNNKRIKFLRLVLHL